MFPIDESSGQSRDRHHSGGKTKDKSALNLSINLENMEKAFKGNVARAHKKFQDFKEKVRVEAMEMEINRCDDNKRLKQVVGGWALSREHMQYLATKPYVYNASAGSYLELLFLQRFWIWLAQYIPLWISPCTITVTGLIINIITSLIVIYYSPDARNEVPSWVFVMCAIGVFLYQTLDALDGKQCYKVQNSQIEEVYDHGCDAVSTVFVTLAVSCAGQLGRTPVLLFLFFLISMIAFFSTHHMCHVTHQMVFGKVDVSEAQWAMILIHLATAYWGQRIWRTPVFNTGLELVHLLALAVMFSMSMAIARNVAIIMGKKTPLDELGLEIKRRTHNLWKPIVPVAILTASAIASYSMGYFHLNPAQFIFTFGFAFAKITIKLVMMNCCNGEAEYWDNVLSAPLLLALNTRFIALLNPRTALFSAFVYSLMDLSRYMTFASWDLRLALDLWIFSIKYPVGHPKNKRDSLGYYVNGLNNESVLKSAQQSKADNESKEYAV